MAVVFERPKSLTTTPFHYCPGCTHGIVHRLVAEVMDELDIQGKTIGVAPVGCAVFAYNYFNCDMIEAAPGVDIRKKLFFTLAERGWALIGLESLGLSLEDIFITVVNKSDEESTPTRYTRRTAKKARNALETQVANDLVADADRRREEASALGLPQDNE